MTQPRFVLLRVCRSSVLIFLVSLLVPIARAAETVHYSISFERPNSHLIDIIVETSGLDGRSVSLAMPYWVDHTARVITLLESEPGRKERSIADTSWDTWLGFRGGGSSGAGVGFTNNLSNTNYSYYDGGQVLGMLLDLEVRHATGNRKSLQDWLRLMYSRYALPKPGFEPEDAVKAAPEIAGTDMNGFFRQYVTGKEPLPYDKEFSYGGVQVVKKESTIPWIGLAMDRASQEGGYRVTNVIPGSPGDLGGVDRGDVLLALDNTTLSSANLDKLLAEHHTGDTVVLTLAHHGSIRQLSVKVASNPYPTYELKPLPQQTKEQRDIFDSLLSTP